MTALDKYGEEGRRSSFDLKSFCPERAGGDISKRYDLDPRECGQGGYGKVYIASDKEFAQKKVAIKKVAKTGLSDPKKYETFYREVKIMKELDHPNICKLLETYEQERFMWFVMELCKGGEVFDRIAEEERISENTTADIVRQVASALRYAHARGIAHRDLKPENICFCDRDGTQVKVIDWGLGFYFGQGARMSSAVGSLTYAAPEVLEAVSGIEYGSACDMWSLGVLTYVMLSGKPPFWGNHREQLKKMKREQFPFRGMPWDRVSAECRDFITSLLRSDVKKRMSVVQVLEHPWFRQAKKDGLLKEEQREVLANLQTFKNNSMFFSICVASVARQLDHGSLKSVHKVFAEMDSNGDGVLELHEVKAGFEKLFGKDSEEANQVEEMFHKLDLDGSGTIDYTEFCAAGIGEHISTQEHVLWAAFKTFDADDNGSISKSEITEALISASVRTAFPKSVCDEVAKEIMSQFDGDGDGTISFDEWRQMMQGASANQIEQQQGQGSARSPFQQQVSEEETLYSELQRASTSGDMDKVREYIGKLNEVKRRPREAKAIETKGCGVIVDEEQDKGCSCATPANGQRGVLRSFTDRLARTITGIKQGQTPHCGLGTDSFCAVM
jgi:calcium-dependent protein kinase